MAASFVTGRVAACTIISRNYAAYARTLQESLRRSNPGIEFHVLVVDSKEEGFARSCGFDRLTWVEELEIPNFRQLAFKFDILELNTDVKPFMLSRLAIEYEYVFYLDPDIYVYGSMHDLVARLKGHTAIITPHSISPIEDGKKPSEIDFLRAGIYNLGFFGMRSCDESKRLLRWWGRRCVELGYNDPRQGLFVDQRFIDLVPSFFEDIVIERSPVYNVAYWNLHERLLDTSHPNHPLVNGKSLVFYHFSGISVDDSAEGRLEISKYQDRSDFTSRPDVKPLFDEYRAQLVRHGHVVLRNLAYGFGHFSNGERINSVSRRLFGMAADQFDSSVDPFHSNGAVYKMLKSKGALKGGPASETPSSYNAHKHSRAMSIMQCLLGLAFRVLGPERYSVLMAYFGYISSLRNQREVFFSKAEINHSAQRRSKLPPTRR